MDLERLRQASEETSWLVGRGYSTDAVAEFVATERGLGEEDRRVLALSTRVAARYMQHIARELDPEDLSKRPLRIDAASVLGVVDAALAGRPVLESPAGIVCDPAWVRPGGPADLEAVVERVAKAVGSVRPSLVRWVIDDAASWADALVASLERRKGKSKMELERVPNAVDVLSRTSYVASSDPVILDGCASWFNLPALALEGTRAVRVKLHL